MSTENGTVTPEVTAASEPVVNVDESSVNSLESGTDEVIETTSETTDDLGETVLRDKGVAELVKTRKRAQEAEAAARKLEQENAYMRGMLDGSKPKEPVKQAVVVPQGPPPRPALDDFDSYEAWEIEDKKHTVAMAKWELAQETAQVAKVQTKTKVITEFSERLNKEAESNPDLIRIAHDQTLPLGEIVSDIIRTSDVGIQILQHLDKNRALAIKIHNMDPIAASREMGKIEASLAGKPKSDPPARISLAPEPVKKVSGTSSSTTVSDADLPIDEFMKRRNQQQFSRR